MSGFAKAFEKRAPDIWRTIQRFPFSIVLMAAAAIIALLGAHEWNFGDDEALIRLFFGAATAAALATGGYLFAESRPTAKWPAILLIYFVPIVGFALHQIRETEWVLTNAIFVISVLWMSLAAFTRIGRGAERDDIQDRFWWLNHRAVTTGVIAAIAVAIIFIGIAAIERSLALLFGWETGDFLYRTVLPVIMFFCAPFYWLATLPRLSGYQADELVNPDFLSRAVGFLGQFILSPLLIAYALILLAYTAQIAVTQTLPQGTLGWMVTAFTITGAANWLVLYPHFMRDRLMVRVFHRWWFRITILPLALYTIGVWVRVDAYGLTFERMMLIAAGIWAVLLTLAHLVPPTRDIRLIPALAAGVLLVLSVGPWNFENAAAWSQQNRLEAAIVAARNPDGIGFNWTNETSDAARSALQYLSSQARSDARIDRALAAQGVTISAGESGYYAAELALDLPSSRQLQTSTTMSLNRPVAASGTSIDGTQFYLGPFYFTNTDTALTAYGIEWALAQNSLVATLPDALETQVKVDLSNLVPPDQASDELNPETSTVRFIVSGRRFNYVITSVNLDRADETTDWRINYLSGQLFSSQP